MTPQNKINAYISNSAFPSADNLNTLTFQLYHPNSQLKFKTGKMSTNPIGLTPNSHKVVLVDDEPAARRVLRSFIESFCPHLQIVGEASGVMEGFKLIREKNPG